MAVLFEKDCLRDFQKEFQESDGASQLKVMFSRSPISSSVNTRKVLVRFRPTPLGLVRGIEPAKSDLQNNYRRQKTKTTTAAMGWEKSLDTHTST